MGKHSLFKCKDPQFFKQIIPILIILITCGTQFSLGQDDNSDKGKVFLCYWNSSSHYNLGDGQFSVNDIDPELCTHIIYGFATINNRTYGMESSDPYLDYGPDDTPIGVEDLYRKTVALRTKNLNLKILIGVGGRKLGTKIFSDMAANGMNRQIFINSAIQIIKKFEFDGIDIDWKYPNKDDKTNFVTLLRDLRKSLDTIEPKPLLTASVGAGIATMKEIYDIPQLTDITTFLSIMAYDYKFYTDTTRHIGHHSPLENPDNDDDIDSVKKTIEYILDQVNNKETIADKIVLGVGAYGRTYTLNSSDQNQIGNIASGLGSSYSYSQEPGFIMYFEMCIELVGKMDWEFQFNDNYKIPYTYNKTQWIGYDDEYSIIGKVDFANEKKLAGMMFWSIDIDDFNRKCGSWYKFPLAQAVKNRMQYHVNKQDQSTEKSEL